MQKIKPYLAVFNTDNEFQLSSSIIKECRSIQFEEKEFNDDLRQKIIANTDHYSPIIILNAKAKLPAFWFERLMATIVTELNTLLCSAQSCKVNRLSPLQGGDVFNGSVEQLDNLIYLLQTPSTLFCEEINTECFIVRNHSVLEQLDSIQYKVCSNLLVQSHNDKNVKLTDKIDIGDQRPLPAHPLAALQWRLKNYPEVENKLLGYPILDKKPVMLHISMSWGGGVSKWINDYCAHETEYNHIVLASYGELYRNRHGEKLQLHYGNDSGITIRNYELQSPIKATSIVHEEYKNILDKILDEFQVQQIMVSSLIGHSMECLQTPIPTVKIFHDYFPSWPSLIANLENDILTSVDIDTALLNTASEPFGEISKETYQSWKEHLHGIFERKKITLVAPSESVKNNLKKIDVQLTKEIHVIPHASKSLIPISYNKKYKSFRILVLGRINPPKGQMLLEDIMEQLNNSFRFVFLGAGNEGKKYLSNKSISVVMDYNQSDLQHLLEKYQPDIALITSQTSETYNYTLTELQQAGICTLSTDFGALKERIENNVTGFICENNSNSFVEKIIQLKSNPEHILKIRENLKTKNFPSFEEQISSFKKLFSKHKVCSYKLNESQPDLKIWATQLQNLNTKNLQLKTELADTTDYLEERTVWAKNLTKELKKAEKNIELERQEVKKIKNTLNKETSRLNNEIAHINQVLKKETNRLEDEINNLNSEYEKLNYNFENEIIAKQTLFNELQSVYQSRSWRVTKPMRRFTTWARHKRNALKFRWTQLRSLPTRLFRSLKTRGVGRTFKLIKGRVSNYHPEIKKTAPVKISNDYKAFEIKTNRQPFVSIIIPVYNHFEHTYQCLKSISEMSEKTEFEVIVIDDCSTDDTENQIKMISGIHYHRQKQNGGFIESCNTGAKLAKGRYLLFLNNDTVVYDLWLDSLINVFEDYPDAGLVGSKLIYPNNQLQEAGGIIFSDACGWNYGRLGNPEEPQYNHVREVDYCSGASILISKELFEELGRFDERYKPAYYEDTDLAFAVRNIGKKVYYQPASVVTHFEGISSGTDLTQGVKKYQVVNQEKFKQKWANQLALQQKSGSDIELCRIHGQPKRILIFDACTPTPDQDSGSLRMMNLIIILKELGYHVIFMPENLSHNDRYTEELQQLGVECIYTPHITNPVDYLKDKGKYLDAVILSRYYVAEQVMPFIREYCPKAQIIFDTVDLHYVRERRMSEISNDKKLASMAEKTREKELDVAKACDVTLVVSPYEVEVLGDEIPQSDVKVLTNIHEIYGCRKPYSTRKDIMFIGGYQHTPNVDAVLWFVEKIFPLIIKQLPEIKFHIIGSRAPKEIQNLASDNIIYHGFVEDIEPFMDDIRIAVAPLRYGAGVKGKVNMSMSYGQPVVGTKVAVEGMYTQEGVDVLKAETPEEFSNQVVRLYQDENLWNTISEGGLKNVENYFSFDAAKKSIQAVLNS
ncbi:MAG: glycosyltransferase [Gammaproteobacteria bacterium]